MFDLAFALILSVTSLLAFIKGFLKSFFSLLNWILASLIAYFLTPFIATIFSEQYPIVGLHSIVSVVVFVIALVLLTLFTTSISQTFLKVVPKQVDQSLGFAFGFTKGYFIVALVFTVITTIYASNSPLFAGKTQAEDGRYGPAWIIDAKSYKILELGANIWQPAIDKVIQMVTGKASKSLDKLEELNDNKEDLEEKMNQINEGLEGVKKAKEIYDNINEESQKGYHKKEIEKMNRLIEAIE